MPAKRYRKRQVEVEAVQWTGENREEVEAFVGDSAKVTFGGAGSANTWMGTATPDNYFVRTGAGGHVIRSRGYFQATYEPVEGGDGHRIEVEFDGFPPSVRLVHPEHGCPQGEEGEGCWLTDWLENEGVELLRGKLTLPVRWEAPADRDHPLFHVLGASPDQRSVLEELAQWCDEQAKEARPLPRALRTDGGWKLSGARHAYEEAGQRIRDRACSLPASPQKGTDHD